MWARRPPSLAPDGPEPLRLTPNADYVLGRRIRHILMNATRVHSSSMGGRSVDSEESIYSNCVYWASRLAMALT